MGWSGNSPVRLPCSPVADRLLAELAAEAAHRLGFEHVLSRCSAVPHPAACRVVSWMLRMESPPNGRSHPPPRGVCLSTPARWRARSAPVRFAARPLLCCQTMAGRRRKSSLPLGVSGIRAASRGAPAPCIRQALATARCSRTSPSGSQAPACKQAYASRRPPAPPP